MIELVNDKFQLLLFLASLGDIGSGSEPFGDVAGAIQYRDSA
jgi:hypothetical protein